MRLSLEQNAAVSDELFGKEVDGFYLCDLLGRGGMGVVYKAVRTEDQAVAAIKILPSWLAQDPVQARRFEREARAAAAASHPNLVQVQNTGALAGGTLFLRMEYLAGETLRQWLASHLGRMPPRQVLKIGAELAYALAAIHRLGIVHRDLKPSNVMLLRQPEHALHVKLLDFGIARFRDEADDLTGTGQVFGTPQYMAPEQCRGEREVSAAVDLYALGIMLFEMLTGTHALQPQNSTREELLRLHVTMLPLSLSRLWPQAPAALVSLLSRLLDKDPRRRPAADEIAVELTRLIEEAPAEALPALGNSNSKVEKDDGTDPPQAPSLHDYIHRLAGAQEHEALPAKTSLSRRHWLRLTIGFLGLSAGVVGLDLMTQHALRRQGP